LSKKLIKKEDKMSMLYPMDLAVKKGFHKLEEPDMENKNREGKEMTDYAKKCGVCGKNDAVWQYSSFGGHWWGPCDECNRRIAEHHDLVSRAIMFDRIRNPGDYLEDPS
jgi:hypothetical protein